MNDTKWHHTMFGSGTQIVSRPIREPHFYIYGPWTGNEDESDRNRSMICKDIMDYLNGEGPRPPWLADLNRVDETHLIGNDGTKIFTTGPDYDADPPHGLWRECDDADAKDARARMMDLLWFGPENKQ